MGRRISPARARSIPSPRRWRRTRWPIAERKIWRATTSSVSPNRADWGAPYFRKEIGLTFSASVEGLPPQRVAALLLEGIAFRVARMLEDMRREFGVERVYLSGGLSNLPCLQQGIARCAPFADVYLLPQSDAGLVGAARLAAGTPLVVEHGARKIAIIPRPSEAGRKIMRAGRSGWTGC